MTKEEKFCWWLSAVLSEGENDSYVFKAIKQKLKEIGYES